MKDDIFNRALRLKQSIDAIDSKVHIIKKMTRSTGDIEFVELQNLAIDALRQLQDVLRKEFEAL